MRGWPPIPTAPRSVRLSGWYSNPCSPAKSGLVGLARTVSAQSPHNLRTISARSRMRSSTLFVPATPGASCSRSGPRGRPSTIIMVKAARWDVGTHPHHATGGGSRSGRPQQMREDVVGSPPQAWGRRRVGALLLLAIAVHPHTRGDGPFVVLSEPPVSGSPPHAWGRPVLLPLRITLLRFTPTRVGTAAGAASAGVALAVHPHTRGDGTR
jgi:hypothetical protein